MIEISLEREQIIKSLKELEKEYNKGNIPKSHYNFQKRKLTEQLDAFEVANRVRRLQGKETTEVAEEETSKEEENGELFKKYITPTGLKEKNLKSEKTSRTSLNTKIGLGVLVAAFFVGIIFGVYGLIPQQVSSAPLYTNDTAFPPFVMNSTNSTNSTNVTRNVTKNVTVTKPVTQNITVKPINTTPYNSDVTTGKKTAAGSPYTYKTAYQDPYSYDPYADYTNW